MVRKLDNRPHYYYGIQFINYPSVSLVAVESKVVNCKSCRKAVYRIPYNMMIAFVGYFTAGD